MPRLAGDTGRQLGAHMGLPVCGFLHVVISDEVLFLQSKAPRGTRWKGHRLLRLILESHVVSFLSYLVGRSNQKPAQIQGEGEKEKMT